MSEDDWEKRKFPRAVGGSGLERWIGIERTLAAHEKEARALLEKVAGPEVAGWIIDAFTEREQDPRGPAVRRPAVPWGLTEWYALQPGEKTVLAGTLGRYVNAQIRIRRLASEGNHEQALTLAVGWMINPEDIKDTEAARVGRHTSCEKWAKGIVQAGVELAESLLASGARLTAQALFDAYKPYTITDKLEVFDGDLVYRVWRQGEYLYEERVVPSGRLKPVSFSTFSKKPYYYPAIRRAVTK